jgi:hypothetical protein
MVLASGYSQDPWVSMPYVLIFHPFFLQLITILVRQFFRAENITVISTDSWDTFSRDSDADDSDDSDDSDGTSFEDKVATAEECRSHLITLQNEAARKEEDKKRGKQLAAEEESTGDGNSGEAKQLTAEGEDNVEDGGSAESQIA